MKFICVGDPHFKPNNVLQSEELQKRVISLVISTEADAVVLLGDLLDTHESANEACFNRVLGLVEAITEYAEVYIIVGNHDYCNNSQFLTTRHFFNPLKEWNRVTVVDYPTMLEDGNDRYIFCPYTPPGRFIEALDKVELWKEARCVFGHQEIRGCKLGAILSEEGDLWSKEHPLLVSGHIHSYSKPQGNVLYVGSSISHSFAETEEKYLLILDFTEESSSLELVPLQYQKKSCTTVDFSKLETLLERCSKKDELVKIKVECNEGEKRELSKMSLPENVVVVPVIKFKEEGDSIGNDFETVLSNLVKRENSDVQRMFKKLLH